MRFGGLGLGGFGEFVLLGGNCEFWISSTPDLGDERFRCLDFGVQVHLNSRNRAEA